MKFSLKNNGAEAGNYSLDGFQRLALGGMFVLTLLTFIGANLHAYLWQSSDWLVSTVLPSVVVKLTNDERSDLSKAPLRRNATLDAAAQMKANHMARNEYFSHYAPDGTSPWYWFNQAGYTYAHAGENLAIHFTDSTEVVDAWMDSPTHRENIVNGNFTEIGVGTAKGEYEGYETVYVVQLFGAPAAAPKPAPAPAPVVAAVTTPKAAPVPAPAAATPTPEPTPAPVTTDVPEITPEATETLEDGDETVLAANTPKETPVAPEVATSTPTTTVATTTGDTNESIDTDVVMIEKSTIATSSGLAAIALDDATTTPEEVAGGVATKPHKLLQIVYVLFGFIVVGLLTASVVVEAKKTRYVQMAYGFGLLAIMAGLWYIHTLLTTGAVIV
jgi:Cysteine-rich secretory protein family